MANLYEVVERRARSFYDRFLRKSELQHQTHYCPGCGHGVVHKLLARAIDELGIQNRTILISPVGCSVFAYYYFDAGNIQAAHGRAPAVATGVKRAHPDSIVISYQGDGDLAAIGTAEIIHAANRGENITVLFVNNAIYGMTGGQMAPTTLVGQKTTTTPFGRSVGNEGFPLRVCELLAALEAPVYLERVALGDNKTIMRAARAIRRAVQNQVEGRGFSLVEILSPCPTIWHFEPVEAQRWVREKMIPVFPLGVYRDRTKEPLPEAQGPAQPIPLEQIPDILRIPKDERGVASQRAQRISEPVDVRLKIAGFGGQGVLLLGQVLAEAGMDAGFQVSWLPSYGPEMRSGTSHCHVRIRSQPIDSPLVSQPSVLMALNEPSLRKFLPQVAPGGWVFYNGEALPEDCCRADVKLVAVPATRIADEFGELRVANMVLLGAWLESTGVLTTEEIASALQRLVSARWQQLDLQALARGRQAVATGTGVKDGN